MPPGYSCRNDRSDPKEKERWLEEQAAMTSMLAGMYEPNADGWTG